MRFSLFILLALVVAPINAARAADPTVIDGDTLDIGDTRYRIHGIDAPERGQSCSALGETWSCGASATERLIALTEGRKVRCDGIEDDGRGRIVAKCYADGEDIGAAMVESGFAWAFLKYSDDYRDAETRARAARRGVWRGPAQAPWDYRAKRWETAAQEAPDGCAIKGNISSRGKIYHAPWSRSYARTRINVARGERWFCSEEEALAAGWRAPRDR